MNKKLILFDFDGVIADSFDQAYRARRLTYKDVASPDQYKAKFAGNIFSSVQDTSPAKIDADLTIFWDYFLDTIHEIKLFEGISEMLKKLHQKYHIAIVSSSREDLIDIILNTEKAAAYFDRIYGSNANFIKVEKFKTACRDFSLTPDDCLFITDTLGDLNEAEKAGIESIAVSWGFHAPENLKLGKHKIIVDSPEELFNEIINHFK